MVKGEPGATLEFDESFDRAWRRVGLALDRSGFTVEDRDRSGGVYFVRYVDPKYAGREEPNFFAKMFSSDKGAGNPQRYRIAVNGPARKPRSPCSPRKARRKTARPVSASWRCWLKS